MFAHKCVSTFLGPVYMGVAKDVDFGIQHFKLCLFVNEGDEETNS